MSRPTAYAGSEKYIFVSYSHKDSDAVLPIIARLNEQGYRVWYDLGIDPGSEWDENIASHITECGYFIAFISNNYLASSNCKDELNFARDLEKERLIVYLEDVQLPSGMAMRVNRLQSIFKHSYSNEEEFYAKLFDAQNIDMCRDVTSTVAADSSPAAPQAVSIPGPNVQPQPKATNKLPIIIAIASTVIALIIVFTVAMGAFSPKDKADGGDDKGSSVVSSQKGTAMSDDWQDFTFELDGKVYQLPCSYDTLKKDGWTISDASFSEDTQIKPFAEENIWMTKNGKNLSIVACNLTTNPVAVKDCTVGGILWIKRGGADIKLAKGITVNSTLDQIIAAYGEPDEKTTEADGSISMTYYCSGSSDSAIMVRSFEESTDSTTIAIVNMTAQ